MISGKNYIGNKQSAKGGKSFKTFNPQLNLENETSFLEATSEEINEAVTLAKNAYREFSKTSGSKKADFLNTIADEILALDDELIQTYC